MRVISGSARGTKLYSLDGENTRPTLDKIKETLFNILQPEIPGSSFLDLFSGSGSIGIEALSEGAAFCAFDTETSGLSYKNDKIIELGAVRFDKGGVLKTYGSFVKIDFPLDRKSVV